ncbi:MAG TPA: hypothetical protein VG205_09360, partial [Acidimicrobiales bacterium]|nr:hypothetical protein [Acidimicrobiales bacterium]
MTPVDRTARREPGIGLTEPVDPSSISFGDLVARFDQRVDAWFEPLRGKPIPDTAARIVSGL